MSTALEHVEVIAADAAAVWPFFRWDNLEAMRAGGFRTHSRLELAPGRYQIRVAALLGETGPVGSVHQDIDVPDLSTPPLAMSGDLSVTPRMATCTGPSVEERPSPAEESAAPAENPRRRR